MSELPDWEDPRVQIVYELLCADLVPPGNDHWEGWVARHIVAALNQSSPPKTQAPPFTPDDWGDPSSPPKASD
jgi:hypothetical protein